MNQTIRYDRLPGGSRLFLDYLYDPHHICGFFAWPYRRQVEFESCARQLDDRDFDRNALADMLLDQHRKYGTDDTAGGNIERLRQTDSLTVFTGQQVGLFGGPLYAIYKTMGAILQARRIAEMLNRPVIPVFWMASDDHDFAEVRWTAFPGPDNKIRRLEYEPASEPERIPISQVALDDRISEVHEARRDVRLETEFSAEIDGVLEEAYRPGVTMTEAFANWMAWVTRGTGLVLFSPSCVEAKRQAVDLFTQEIQNPKSSADRLEWCNLRIQESGYRLQVSHPKPNTHLFHANGQRNALQVQGDGQLTDGIDDGDKNSWAERLQEHPERFSPGVLFRPVMQNYLFPAVAYVAGPSEISYWAQARALFEVFDVVQPIVLSRPFVTLLERKIRKAVEKLELSVPDVLTDREQVVNEVAQRTFPPDLHKKFGETVECFTDHIDKLNEAVTSFEPTLKKSFEQGAGRIRGELTNLEKKAFQAHKRRNEIIRDQVYKVSAHLYPENTLQERVFGLPYYLNKYGPDLIAYVLDRIAIDTQDHQIIDLSL